VNERYRIGIINDYRGSFAFIDYKVFGELKVYDACWTQGVAKIQDGKIHVFLNFKKVGCFDKKSEAASKLRELIEQAPCSWFEENKEVLLKGLC
jgi:hypothetical protein